MKRLLSILPMVAAMLLTVASCKEKEPLGPTALTAPTLTSSVQDIIIDEYTDDVILSFGCTDAGIASGLKDANADLKIDEADGYALAYSLQLTQASDTEFASGTSYEMTGLSKTFSANELANVASEIGADIKNGFTLAARVRVTCKDFDAVLSNVVNVTIAEKAYEITSLYPIGEATNWGWSQDAAEAMTNNNGVFTWTGHLYKNAEFKFLCQNNGEWWPGIVKNLDAGDAYAAMLTFDDTLDNKFKVDESGTYKITVDATNSNNINLTVEFIEGDPKLEVNELYVLGSACSAGWNLDAMEAFTNDGGVFTWQGKLNAYSEFRFPLQKQSNVWWPGLMITEDGQGIVFGASDDDKVIYQVEEAGIYKIVIDARDTENMTVSIEYVGADEGFAKVYPIGGFNWGWSQDNAEEMTTTDGVTYTWTGTIYENSDFKFLFQNNGNWVPGLNRDANAAEYWTMVKRNSDSDPDVQFQVSKTGTYTITLNIETLAISVVEAAFAKIYPIGGVNWGWSQDAAEEMTTTDGITYTWTGTIFENSDFKFLFQNDGNWVPSLNRDTNATEYWTMVKRNTYDDPDDQFQVSKTGTYNVTLKLDTMSLSVEYAGE